MTPTPPTTMELIQLAGDVERLRGKYRGTLFTEQNKRALVQDCLSLLVDMEVKGVSLGFVPMVGDLAPIFIEDEGPAYGMFDIAFSDRMRAWILSGRR